MVSESLIHEMNYKTKFEKKLEVWVKELVKKWISEVKAAECPKVEEDLESAPINELPSSPPQICTDPTPLSSDLGEMTKKMEDSTIDLLPIDDEDDTDSSISSEDLLMVFSPIKVQFGEQIIESYVEDASEEAIKLLANEEGRSRLMLKDLKSIAKKKGIRQQEFRSSVDVARPLRKRLKKNKEMEGEGEIWNEGKRDLRKAHNNLQQKAPASARDWK